MLTIKDPSKQAFQKPSLNLTQDRYNLFYSPSHLIGYNSLSTANKFIKK